MGKAASSAKNEGIRVLHLHASAFRQIKGRGALSRLAPAFKLGLGDKLSQGQQPYFLDQHR